MKKPLRSLLKRRSPYILSLTIYGHTQPQKQRVRLFVISYCETSRAETIVSTEMHWEVFAISMKVNVPSWHEALIADVQFDTKGRNTAPIFVTSNYTWLQELGVVTDDMYWTTGISCTWIFLSMTARGRLFILPYFLNFRTPKEYIFSFGKY